MKPPKDQIRLKHMRDAAEKAVKLTGGKSRKDFDDDEALGFAITRLLEIIGEAARGMSSEIKKGNPSIPWQQMIGTHNHLIHGYFDIDYDLCGKSSKKNFQNWLKTWKKSSNKFRVMHIRRVDREVYGACLEN